MSEHLSSSVGIVRPGTIQRAGAKPGNKQEDQRKVISLLSKIPAKQGGKKEDWATPPAPGQDGFCQQSLADAIWAFQSFWKANGTFKNIDGVVDPGGNTLRVLNTLLITAAIAKAGPNPQLPANTTDLTKLAASLRSLLPHATKWSLTNAPGISVGFIASGAGGQLDVKEDGAAAKEKYLTYLSGGIEMGWSPEGNSPVTFSASTRDMASATSIKGLSGMGRIFSRLPNLTFEDMTGPMAIFGITGAAPMKFYTEVAEAVGTKMIQGVSFSVFMLGIQPEGREILTRLPATGNITAGMINAVKDCKAICMSAGEVIGLDISIGLTIGYATGYFNKFDFLDTVENKEYADKYKSAEKTVKDMVNKGAENTWNKIKDWSPF